MAAIRTILLRLRTGPEPQASTNGDVYLGIAGREFRIEAENPPGQDLNDFERGADWTYILGQSPPAVEPDMPPLRRTVKNKPEYIASGQAANVPNDLYQLDTDLLVGPDADLNMRFPVYIRLEPKSSADNWHLLGATCLVIAEVQPNPYYVAPWLLNPRATDSLWLGTPFGKYCYLRSLRPVVGPQQFTTNFPF